jgi:hypothetical protein
MSLQALEKRFGMVAVQKGYITIDQLIEAIAVQIREELELNKHRLLGQILLEKGFLTPPTLKQVLDQLGLAEGFLKAK